MKNSVKKSALGLALCLLLLAFAGCGGREEADDHTLSLLIKQSDSEKIYVQRILRQYEEQTGSRISTIVIEDVDFEKEAEARVLRGDVPDLFYHFHNSTLDLFQVSENFYYLEDQSWVGDLTDGAKAYCADSEGHILGLPFWESSISGCYYNKTILDQLGLRPASTQAEFDVLCQALKSIGYTPLYWAANGCNWMFQFGLGPVFADRPDLLERLNQNEITYADIPEVGRMAQWLADARKNGWFNSDYGQRDWHDIGPAMAKGEAVCVFIWDTWFSTDLPEGERYTSEDFALMPVFMGTADSGTYEGGNLNMLMVNKNSPRLEQALGFLAFCATPEHYNAAFEGVYTVNCFRGQTSHIQSPMVTDAMVSIQANQRPSVVWPKVIGYQQDDVGEAVRRLFDGEVDPAGCVGLMDEYRIAAARELEAEGF